MMDNSEFYNNVWLHYDYCDGFDDYNKIRALNAKLRLIKSAGTHNNDAVLQGTALDSAIEITSNRLEQLKLFGA